MAWQLSPEIIELPGLRIVRTIDDALAALDTIIEQGEGSSCDTADCHFARFRTMRQEWSTLEALNPSFVPAHEAAHDPVMRKPADGLKRVWVTEPRSARLLDLGNALYGAMLGMLSLVYSPALPQPLRKRVMNGSVSLMHPLASLGRMLAKSPADEQGTSRAGLTFAVPRNLHGYPPEDALPLLREQLAPLCQEARSLEMHDVARQVDEVAEMLGKSG